MRKQTDRQSGSQPVVVGSSPTRITIYDASVAGRTPRPSSVGISGSSPDGIANPSPDGEIAYTLSLDLSAFGRAGASPALGTTSM